MQYENDIFISYAHLDNESPIKEQLGWISLFHRALEVWVGQLLGKKPNIWRDPKMQGNDYISEALLERLPKCTILLSVVSPRYIKSEWCTRELQEFCRRSERHGGVRIGDKSRIFKVIKTPVPLEQHPEPIRPLRGYEFYTRDPDTGRERELNVALGPDAKKDFIFRLNDLAHDIRNLLDLADHSDPRELVTRIPPGSPKATVFLADTSFELQDERDAIQRDLLEHGYHIIPDYATPMASGDPTSALREGLAKCQMSVHLIGRNYGVVPEGIEKSVSVIEYELAAERGQANTFRQIIWMPPHLDIYDERQARFIESLRTDPRLHQWSDVLESSLEELKTLIHQRLAQIANPEPEIPDVDPCDCEVVRIYMIVDQRDQDASRALEDYLFDQGHEVILPVFEGDEVDVREDHEENLKTCEAVLIYWGEADQLWLRSKRRDLWKIRGYGRSSQPLAQAVYVAPPMNPEKERFRAREHLVLNQPAEFDPAALEPFLTAIEAARTPRL